MKQKQVSDHIRFFREKKKKYNMRLLLYFALNRIGTKLQYFDFDLMTVLKYLYHKYIINSWLNEGIFIVFVERHLFVPAHILRSTPDMFNCVKPDLLSI
jgi:hypothetical protein